MCGSNLAVGLANSTCGSTQGSCMPQCCITSVICLQPGSACCAAADWCRLPPLRVSCCCPGSSIAQQQQLTLASKLAHTQQCTPSSSPAAEHTGAEVAGCAVGGGGAADGSMLCSVCQQLQQQLDLRALLEELAAAAKGSSSQPDLLAQLDAISEQWLQQQLSCLLHGTVACSISSAARTRAAPADCSAMSWPLLAAAAAGQPAAAACKGLLVCRMVPPAAGQPAQLPLLVKLQP